MTTVEQTRAEFLAERSKGLGGSDIAAVFNIGYAGCAKRLWHEKRGDKPDFPRGDNDVMALGRVLEPFFARKYMEMTGNQVYTEPVNRHPEHPELLVHIDRRIHDLHRDGDGVLEIKSLGRQMFFKTKREGVAEEYILQLNHGMLVAGMTWGEFAIGSRDSGELLPPFPMERDEEVCSEIIAAGTSFWKQIQEGGPAPGMLSPDDPRCHRCEYRRSCQGAALMEVAKKDKGDVPTDESLRPLLQEYDERSAMADEADGLIEETKEAIRAALGERTAVRVAGRPIYFRPQTRRTWAAEDLAKMVAQLRGKVDYDGTFLPGGMLDIDREFKRESDSRPLRIY